MNPYLLDRIESLAGPQRAKTFRAAAEFVMQTKCGNLIETGCYRGIIGDGQSTLILGLLAQEITGTMTSFDTCPDHVYKARTLLDGNFLDRSEVILSDSIVALSDLKPASINFAYLDSYDHDPNNPGPCQRHELAEIGAILGKMALRAAILLDDCVPETGGKTLLGAQFLKERGWTLAEAGYQLLFIRT